MLRVMLCLACLPAGPIFAQDPDIGTPADAAGPIVLFETDNIRDDSFNAAAKEGLESFQKHRDTTVEYLAGDAHNRGDLEKTVRQALEHGHSPIICVGFAYNPFVSQLARTNPGTRFVLIDSKVENQDELENVQSIVFREEQGSFLVGVLAALTTETGVIGFVGGRDCDVIRNFACGFAQGVQYQSPEAHVLVKMAGTTGAAFKAPAIGARLARDLVAARADVIFHAAGGTGRGVIETARELGILAIGVDLNQNSLAPGTMLTSMLKRVDVAVYLALSEAADGVWEPGVRWLGLEEDGVGWALDEHNLALVPLPVQKRMEEVHFDIVMGQTAVHRYADDGRCPAHEFKALQAQ